MASKKILFLGLHFAPEEVSGAQLATELFGDLASRGHRIEVVTCFPNYPEGKVFPGYGARPYFRETMDGVGVVRVWSYISSKRTFLRRMLHFLTFSVSALPGGLLAGRPDVILSASPPFPLGLAAWVLSRWWKTPWILRVEDLYPDAAVKLGMLRNRHVVRGLFRLERFFYEKADHISLISEGFRRNLLSKGVPAQKLSVNPVWADPDIVKPLSRENHFRRIHGLTGKFVVLYAGNLGLTASLEEVLDAAAALRGDPDIRFVLVGEGVQRASLRANAAQRRLKNLLFLPFQPRSAFAEMMAAADVGLVTLTQASSETSLPSKTFNIMASSRPVVAITPRDSELAALVAEEARCGVCVEPGDPNGLAQAIMSLKNEPVRAAAMGERGRTRLVSHYARTRCIDRYERLLEQVTA